MGWERRGWRRREDGDRQEGRGAVLILFYRLLTREILKYYI